MTVAGSDNFADAPAIGFGVDSLPTYLADKTFEASEDKWNSPFPHTAWWKIPAGNCGLVTLSVANSTGVPNGEPAQWYIELDVYRGPTPEEITLVISNNTSRDPLPVVLDGYQDYYIQVQTDSAWNDISAMYAVLSVSALTPYTAIEYPLTGTVTSTTPTVGSGWPTVVNGSTTPWADGSDTTYTHLRRERKPSPSGYTVSSTASHDFPVIGPEVVAIGWKMRAAQTVSSNPATRTGVLALNFQDDTNTTYVSSSTYLPEDGVIREYAGVLGEGEYDDGWGTTYEAVKAAITGGTIQALVLQAGAGGTLTVLEYFDVLIYELTVVFFVEAANVGQLYVNLSTDENAPNWVSVCPSSPYFVGSYIDTNSFSATWDDGWWETGGTSLILSSEGSYWDGAPIGTTSETSVSIVVAGSGSGQLELMLRGTNSVGDDWFVQKLITVSGPFTQTWTPAVGDQIAGSGTFSQAELIDIINNNTPGGGTPYVDIYVGRPAGSGGTSVTVDHMLFTGGAVGWQYYDATITSPAKASTDIVYRDSTAYSWTTNVTTNTNYLFKLQHNVGAAQTVAASNAVGIGAAGTFTLFGFIQPGILIGIRDVDLAGTAHVTTFDADTLAIIDSVVVPTVSGYSLRRYYAMHDGWHAPTGSGQFMIWYYGGASGYVARETFVTSTGTIPAFTTVTLPNTFGPNDKGHMYNGDVWCGQMLITTGVNSGQSRARAFDMSTRNWTAPQNLPAGTTDQYTVYFQNDYLPTAEHFSADEWTPMYAGSGSNVGSGPTTRYICKMQWDGGFEYMTNLGGEWAVPDASTWERVFAIRLTTGEAVAMLTKTGPVVDGNTTTIVEIWYDLFGLPEKVGTYQDYNSFAASSRPYIRVSTQGSFMMMWSTDSKHRQWQRTEPDLGYLGHFNISQTATPNWLQIHLENYHANTATSGAPVWYTCCSHG